MKVIEETEKADIPDIKTAFSEETDKKVQEVQNSSAPSLGFLGPLS